MITTSEKKLYKVLRNVGVKRQFITWAESIEDLYLDDFDFNLLVYYFEHEFEVQLKKDEIEQLTSLPAFYDYINEKIKMN
ncbi:hypothetical protein [Roseimarinus sediminis]|uniref:hypothetical protein n=1 Tax=Roseimarinus sediminis TaxID=1610899 RepID=UPI003D20F596